MKYYLISAAVVLASTAMSPMQASAHDLSGFCQGVYSDYSDTDGPKAFVTGNDGSCWWWHGTPTLKQSIKNALNACRNSGAAGCKVRETAL